MSKIRIKNFGPVKEGYQDNEGWLDVKKVTLFIGNQGSGKSTVAKLISTFTWIEKVLVRGDYEQKWFESNGKIKKSYFPYHRIENYDSENLAEIEYYGDAYHFKYEKGNFVVEKIENENFPLPQIMYVPAERNFLTYVRSPKKLEVSSRSLLEFATEYINAEDNLKSTTVLPINNVEIEYNKRHDMLYLKGKDYKIKITEASSGFQSFVPLYLVSDYLAKSIKGRSENYELSPEDQEKFRKNADAITADISLTDEQKRIAISSFSKKINKTAFINIVEEPEQNLFPSSQWKMLQSLLEFNNMNEGNKLILTTHSPYLINYFTLAVKADELKKKVCDDGLKAKLQKIVPFNATVSSDDLVIYELDETNGNIKKLGDYKGLPSDENYLNDGLGKTNDLFVELLKIEDQCQ